MTIDLVQRTRAWAMLVAAIVPMILLSACDAEKPVAGTGTTDPFFLLVGGSFGRSFLNLDNATVRGYLKVTASGSLDSHWGVDGGETSLMAICGNTDGSPLAIGTAKANGVPLVQKGQSTHIFVEDAPQTALAPGQDVNWDVTLPSTVAGQADITFSGSIPLPPLPTITSLAEYAGYSKGRDLTVNWRAGSDPNAEAVISIAVDPMLTEEEGGDISHLNRASNPTLSYTETTNDDGQFTIPLTDLEGFPDNVYVRVTVTTFDYQTQPRSDGERYGLIAVAQYNVPIKLIP